MTTLDKNIINAHLVLLEKESDLVILEIIERLNKFLEKKKSKKNLSGLEKSFGAWESDKTAEEIIAEINGDLRFENQDIQL